ncbi:PBSX family phage terminase large subunit [Cetobacterium ceti]|uniref:PBSX family phage terminase large subunit n=1 Tax=Cetobacterium ceti TaxID=180163 RepID=UPI0013563231|nr:PBSX family phage terminase large subunit [Cetobacterium ceti]
MIKKKIKRSKKLTDIITPAFYKSYYTFKNNDVLEMVEYGGRGGGKSSNVFMFPVLRALREKTDCLVLRKVANTVKTSVFNQVIWCINALGVQNEFKINKSNFEILHKKHKNGFYFKGADDPMKIKSIKTLYPIATTIFEEVDQFKDWDEVDHIKQSVLRGDVENFKLIYLFNPQRNKYHWANQKWLFGNNDGIFVHKSTYLDNPHLPIQFVKEAEKAKKENLNRYKWIYLGEPVGADIVPFPNLIVEKELDQSLIDSFDNIRQGNDWGYGGDPFAFVRTHYDKKKKIIYIFDEIYGCGLSNAEAAKRIIQKGYNDFPVISDSAEPKSIDYFEDEGIPTYGAKKGAGSIENGLRWLGEHTIIVCEKRCPNTAKELKMADFKKDKNGNLTGKLEGLDHAIDALRYAYEDENNYRTAKVYKI